MRAAIRPHSPWVARSAAWSTFGLRGQNTQRPNAARATGRKVIITSRVQAMPIAATGPRLWFDRSSEKLRQSSPTMTVAAEARIAGADSRQALIMASKRFGYSCNSSR